MATLAAAESPAAAPHHPPRIVLALLRPGITPAELASVHGMAIGLLSAGIGEVPATQTYIDIGQSNRVPSSLYDEPAPFVYARPASPGAPPRIPAPLWNRVRERAAGAPADLLPGLLGSTLVAGHVRTKANVLLRNALAIIATEDGRVAPKVTCSQSRCGRVHVVATNMRRLATLARQLRGNDLLIAMARPPPQENRALAIGVAGKGFEGTLTSDSTRMRGYVLSTDIAPTVLARLGLEVPDAMTGEPIRASGEVDPAFLQSLEDRLAAIGPRRGPVIGTNVLIWIGLAALAGIFFGVRGLRVSLPVLAVALAWLPALLLLTAALEPSQLAERLVAGIGGPALAVLTVRVWGGFGGLAIAGAASVAGYAVDVIAGSHLTELSLIGPNPAEGVRFYGIGNELEATVAALVPIATGAAVTAWAPPRISARGAAFGFALTALVAVVAFAPGQFGADVGAAIGIPIGAAVAALVCLGAGRRRLALALAAPIVALALLAVADLLLGANAHLTRTVFRAGGLDQVAEVAERRLRLSAHSFGQSADTAGLWLAVAAIGAGLAGRRRVEAWFGDRRVAWAGLLGAFAATLAGTLANDSGALLLIVGTTLCAATAGLAWATQARHRASGP
ncbi:MAG TPA: hypothetical protein VEL05_10600 [Candidatus Acidoferrum sp.]|nr:hypothetical protein [Candidatus Acidoferrum sp.]